MLSQTDPYTCSSGEERAGAQPVLISVPPTTPRFAFDKAYAKYPRKRGKDLGMEACAKLIRTPGDFAALLRGVEAFAAEAKRLGTPKDKIPYWSTFVNERRWVDFTDEATPPEPVSLEDLMSAGVVK